MSDVILGLYQGYNASAAIVVDGNPVVVVEKERISGNKHADGSGSDCVQQCLAFAQLGPEDITTVAVVGASDYDYPHLYATREKMDARYAFPAATCIRMSPHQCYRQTEIELFGKAFSCGIVEHHVAHGATAYFLSPFTSSTVLSYDGWGDFRRSFLIGRAESNILTPVKSLEINVGMTFKKAATHLFRFRGCNFDGAGKLMGLAAYGQPKYREGTDLLFDADPYALDWHNMLLPGIGQLKDGQFRDHDTALARDFAASLQESAETRVVEALAPYVDADIPLCVSGGCALNVRINRRLQEEFHLSEVFVPPCPHDGGLPLGAALYVRHTVHRAPFGGRIDFAPFLGCNDLDRLDSSIIPLIQAHRLRVVTNRRGEIPGVAAKQIAAGRIVGVCTGRSEIGPRALGNRSILADARRPEMQVHLNNMVKHREPFRPFGLAILESDLHNYYPGAPRSPYMMHLAGANDRARKAFPAVVHVDGTTRIQTVPDTDAHDMGAILRSLKEQTGCPGVVNTSYNLAGAPIAETADDCLRTFMGSGIDLLQLGSLLLEKQ